MISGPEYMPLLDLVSLIRAIYLRTGKWKEEYVIAGYTGMATATVENSVVCVLWFHIVLPSYKVSEWPLSLNFAVTRTDSTNSDFNQQLVVVACAAEYCAHRNH